MASTLVVVGAVRCAVLPLFALVPEAVEAAVTLLASGFTLSIVTVLADVANLAAVFRVSLSVDAAVDRLVAVGVQRVAKVGLALGGALVMLAGHGAILNRLGAVVATAPFGALDALVAFGSVALVALEGALFVRADRRSVGNGRLGAVPVVLASRGRERANAVVTVLAGVTQAAEAADARLALAGSQSDVSVAVRIAAALVARIRLLGVLVTARGHLAGAHVWPLVVGVPIRVGVIGAALGELRAAKDGVGQINGASSDIKRR